MGFISKIKNIFYDIEEVEEVPAKKEEVKVEEIVFPKKEEVKEEVKVEEPKVDTYTERELFQSKSTFNFPIFDDEEEPIKTRTRTSEPVSYEKKAAPRQVIKEPERPVVTEKKTFTPSLVISPVYGILDKNYTKEEVVEKKNEINNKEENGKDYDYVRRKAYGTLEDELENTLTKMNNKVLESVDELTKEIETLNRKTNIEDLIDEIGDTSKITIGDLEEHEKDKMDELEDEEPKNETVNVDNTLEHDLFNLIDSMYEKEDK